jgi:beta-glucanase (GH16 family)
VVVSHQILDLETYRDPRLHGRWVSGGVSSYRAVSQSYGKYEVRFRIDPGYGIRGALLLWPAHSMGPPEVDFATSGVASRSRLTAALFDGSATAEFERTENLDLTQWHTAGVEWTPGLLVFTLDGHAWSSIRSRAVPSQPMVMDMQTAAETCPGGLACATSATPALSRLQVAWVRIYRYSPIRP